MSGKVLLDTNIIIVYLFNTLGQGQRRAVLLTATGSDSKSDGRIANPTYFRPNFLRRYIITLFGQDEAVLKHLP